MRPFPILIVLFIGIPLVEIYLFISVGGLIGALPTVLLIIVTALLGVKLLRSQGLHAMSKFQQEISAGQLPAITMLEGIALIFGGALLLTPGFLTDTIGFLCLIPFTRKAFIIWLVKNIKLKSSGPYASSYAKYRDSSIIEGEFKKSDKDSQE